MGMDAGRAAQNRNAALSEQIPTQFGAIPRTGLRLPLKYRDAGRERAPAARQERFRLDSVGVICRSGKTGADTWNSPTLGYVSTNPERREPQMHAAAINLRGGGIS